jgi:hypothetical protein
MRPALGVTRMRRLCGPQPQRVAWKRPSGEAPNSHIPRTAPLVQHAVRRDDMEMYCAMKVGPRDETKSRELRRNVYKVPGYRTMAKQIGCATRTAFNRRRRIVEARLCTFIERTDETGRILGSWLIDNDWKDITEDWRRDPQIAKTPTEGYPIVRNFRFVSPAHAMECSIEHVSVVVRTQLSNTLPQGHIAAGRPDVSEISTVLTKFAVPDQDAKGALALLEEARAQFADISPAELAEALDAELQKRAGWKAKVGQKLEINVPYIKTFIRSVAGLWAAGREERRRESATSRRGRSAGRPGGRDSIRSTNSSRKRRWRGFSNQCLPVSTRHVSPTVTLSRSATTR